MRIGIVTGEYPPMQGGVGAYSRIIANKFADAEHDVYVFSDKSAYEVDPRISLTKTAKWGIGTLKSLRRWSLENALDVVVLQFETAAFGMSPWIHFLPEALREIPLVTCFHDLLVPYLFPKAGAIRDWIVMRLARASTGVIVTNHEDFRRLRHLPVIELIPIGSNITSNLPDDYDRKMWRSRAGAADEDFLLAHFGFLNRTKGVDILLEDMASLLEAQVCPVRLLMIGGRIGASDPANIAYADEIDSRIEHMGIGPYIHWTGFVNDDEVSAYLHAADAIVLPFRDGASYRRGSLMAAIHHGCSIITTAPKVDVPTFVDGENMLLVYQEIIDADVPPYVHVTPQILRLYRNPALRKRLAQGARDLSKSFDWDYITAAYLALFERILEVRS